MEECGLGLHTLLPPYKTSADPPDPTTKLLSLETGAKRDRLNFNWKCRKEESCILGSDEVAAKKDIGKKGNKDLWLLEMAQ